MTHPGPDSLKARALELLANGVGEKAVVKHLGITQTVFDGWLVDAGFQTTLEVYRAEADSDDATRGALLEAQVAFGTNVGAATEEDL